LPPTRFVARKTHFHFTTHLRFSGAVFAVKTDFSQPASQPPQTLCGCPLPHQNTCAHTQPDKVSPAPCPCAHASICKNTLPETQLTAPRALCRKSLYFALILECASLLRGVKTPCGSTCAFTHQPARRSPAPCPSKAACADTPPFAHFQQFKTRRRSFSSKRTLTRA